MITCKFEDGGDASLRHVTVGAIVVNYKNEILLVKRAPHLTNGNKFCFPGGFLDRDETTRDAVLRELSEETGYTGNIISFFQIIDNPERPKEDRQNVDFRYIVKVTGGSKKDNDEVSGIYWMPLDQLPEKDEWAFDHRESIELYKEYLKEKFTLPVVNWDKK